ncbi:proteasome subunit beta [Vibrio parahaemolyticus]|uniref:proteasome subunit beta n=1 Tax=Vibrio parahaemolyticus TaxID=670 RepID=UPI000C9A4128|nr:proteasome subunit beta [Vibrio parahaemolyticus]PMS91934.1 proteasome subunit beta [Vibrio parahaemolyticus]
MTTLAYHHDSKTIAYDSRVSCGSGIVTDDYEKSTTKDGVIFVFAGDIADQQRFIEDYPNLKDTYDIAALVIESGVVYHVLYEHKGHPRHKVDHDYAIGSGADHAITAMDVGLSAEDAVKMAIKRNLRTGGEVRTITL